MQRQARKFSDEQILDAFDLGDSIEVIAARIGHPPSSVAWLIQQLRPSGIRRQMPKEEERVLDTTATASEPAKTPARDEIAALREQGLLNQEIAQRLGITEAKLSYWVTRYGLASPRPRPAAKAMEASKPGPHPLISFDRKDLIGESAKARLIPLICSLADGDAYHIQLTVREVQS